MILWVVKWRKPYTSKPRAPHVNVGSTMAAECNSCDQLPWAAGGITFKKRKNHIFVGWKATCYEFHYGLPRFGHSDNMIISLDVIQPKDAKGMDLGWSNQPGPPFIRAPQLFRWTPRLSGAQKRVGAPAPSSTEQGAGAWGPKSMVFPMVFFWRSGLKQTNNFALVKCFSECWKITKTLGCLKSQQKFHVIPATCNQASVARQISSPSCSCGLYLSTVIWRDIWLDWLVISPPTLTEKCSCQLLLNHSIFGFKL